MLGANQASKNCANKTVSLFDSLFILNILAPHKIMRNLVCLKADCSKPLQAEVMTELYTIHRNYNVSHTQDNFLLQFLPSEPKQNLLFWTHDAAV